MTEKHPALRAIKANDTQGIKKAGEEARSLDGKKPTFTVDQIEELALQYAEENYWDGSPFSFIDWLKERGENVA